MLILRFYCFLGVFLPFQGIKSIFLIEVAHLLRAFALSVDGLFCLRYYEMIDDSDFGVFYYNEAYLPPQGVNVQREI